MGIGLRWDVLAIKAKTTGLDLGVVVESEEGESRYPDASMTSVKAGAPPDQ